MELFVLESTRWKIGSGPRTDIVIRISTRFVGMRWTKWRILCAIMWRKIVVRVRRIIWSEAANVSIRSFFPGWGKMRYVALTICCNGAVITRAHNLHSSVIFVENDCHWHTGIVCRRVASVRRTLCFQTARAKRHDIPETVNYKDVMKRCGSYLKKLGVSVDWVVDTVPFVVLRSLSFKHLFSNLSVFSKFWQFSFLYSEQEVT